MKNNIRILLLCVIGIAGALQQKLYGQTLDIYQIKVSIGHATLVVYKDASAVVRKSVLIDAGDNQNDAILIREVIKNVADNKLDRVYITHGDKDHWGGMPGANGLLKNLEMITPTEGSKVTLMYNGMKSTGHRNWRDTPPTFKNALNQIIDNNVFSHENWDLKDWSHNEADYDLGGSATIKTLAIDCKLNTWVSGADNMSGCDNNKAEGKNNRSGVLLISWGDFSYLIQGDLQASSSDTPNPHERIAATISAYNPLLRSETRLPSKWNDGLSQWTITISEQEYNDNVLEGSGLPYTEGIVRKPVKSIVNTGKSAYNPTTGSRKRKREASATTTAADFKTSMTTVNQFNNNTFIAWPDKGRHELAELINTHNGSLGYGEVTVGLVPHHGGLTSNLWFSTKHAIYGTPVTPNRHPHPEFHTVQATYNTVGARYMYFTYLNDGSGSRKYSRTDYFNSMSMAGSISKYELNDTYDYFKINVTNIGSRFRISRAKKDGSGSNNVTEVLSAVTGEIPNP